MQQILSYMAILIIILSYMAILIINKFALL